jgi:bifunctional enzyme CysN/CysC/sulfate adenylyltransferase subunit 1
VERDSAHKPLRFPVQNVLRAHLDDRGLAGQIVSGALAVGDEVVVLPSGARSRVRAIETFDGPLSRAWAPMPVVVRRADDVDAGRGDVIAHPGSEPMVLRRLEARTVWLAEQPLDLARAYLIKHGTRTSRAWVEAVRSRLDPETGEEGPAPSLALNDIGTLAVRSARPLAADPYRQNRATGGFILIDLLTNQTVAAGLITAGPEPSAQPRSGTVVLVAGETEAVSVLRAHQLERLAGEGGLLAAVVRRPLAARACAAAGLLGLFPAVEKDLAAARDGLRKLGVEPIELSGEIGPESLRRAIEVEDR